MIAKIFFFILLLSCSLVILRLDFAVAEANVSLARVRVWPRLTFTEERNRRNKAKGAGERLENGEDSGQKPKPGDREGEEITMKSSSNVRPFQGYTE